MKKNEVKVFENEELGLQVRTILNPDGSISVSAEDTAIGFGWCRTEMKNGREYTSIRWSTLNSYCKELGFANELAKEDYIPESLYYLLGMKANNEKAQKYQRWLAMDVLPTLRKTGSYEMPKQKEKSQSERLGFRQQRRKDPHPTTGESRMQQQDPAPHRKTALRQSRSIPSGGNRIGQALLGYGTYRPSSGHLL